MSSLVGQSLDALDTPQLLLDLDILDANLAYLQRTCTRSGKDLRVHFKSLKCGSLARYLSGKGVRGFLCASSTRPRCSSMPGRPMSSSPTR